PRPARRARDVPPPVDRRAGDRRGAAAARHDVTVAVMRASPGVVIVVVSLVVACSARAPSPSSPREAPGDRGLAAEIARFLDGHFRFRPSWAVELGHHEYDGKVPDR